MKIASNKNELVNTGSVNIIEMNKEADTTVLNVEHQPTKVMKFKQQMIISYMYLTNCHRDYSQQEHWQMT